MNFNSLLKQAQQMQKKVNKVKKTLDEKEYEFVSQENMITGKIKGNLDIIELHINPNMMNKEHQEEVEDLLIVTLNQKIQDIQKEREDTLNKLTNGVDVSAFL